jgi:hypothetical protein
MNEAVSSISELLEGKLSKSLRNFLKETFDDMEMSSESLAVIDAKIGNINILIYVLIIFTRASI